MMKLSDIVDDLRALANWGPSVIWNSLAQVVSVLTTVRFLVKKGQQHAQPILALLLLVFVLCFGLLLPVSALIFSTWSSTGAIVINLLSICGLLFLTGLLYIWWRMRPFMMKPNSTAPAIQTATILLRTTQSFFSGNICVHLLDETFSGRPMRHQVTVKIWSPGYPEALFKSKDTGYSTLYTSGHHFRVRILSAAINEATIEVTQS